MRKNTSESGLFVQHNDIQFCCLSCGWHNFFLLSRWIKLRCVYSASSVCILNILNSPINTSVQVSLGCAAFDFLGQIPTRSVAGSYAVFFLGLEEPHIIFIVAAPVYIPFSSSWMILFPYVLASTSLSVSLCQSLCLCLWFSRLSLDGFIYFKAGSTAALRAALLPTSPQCWDCSRAPPCWLSSPPLPHPGGSHSD